MKSLFDETKINGLVMKNRFIRSATWLNKTEEDGHINSKLKKIYKSLAKGGVGLIITGYAFVSKEEQPNPNMLAAYSDDFIEDFRQLADAVHGADGKIALQLAYGGSQCTHEKAAQMHLIGPSAVQNPVTGLTPAEATKEEISAITKQFGEAALRAKEAGMDGVQIHAGHGYLLGQWLTPYFNHRTDEYGGDIHGRARVLYEAYDQIRSRVGDDYPVMIKMNCDDCVEGEDFLHQDGALQVAKKLDEMGMDLIEISGGTSSFPQAQGSISRKMLFSKDEQSYFRKEAAAIASEMRRAKVALVGGNRDFGLMTELLQTTEISYFALSRPLLCEPDLINKWDQNHEYKPKCSSCGRCFGKNGNDCVIF
ncbi:MAG: NADH:flavin oxidoreductase [Christensenella sp.]|nr:NADH:flavin oxidoreductase [Christensenella sp.]